MNKQIYLLLKLEILIVVFIRCSDCKVIKSEVYSLNDSHSTENLQKYYIKMHILFLEI